MAQKTTSKKIASKRSNNTFLFAHVEKRERAPIIPDISLLAHLTPEQRAKVITQGEAIRQTVYDGWLRNIDRDNRDVIRQIRRSYNENSTDNLGDETKPYEEQ